MKPSFTGGFNDSNISNECEISTHETVTRGLDPVYEEKRRALRQQAPGSSITLFTNCKLENASASRLMHKIIWRQRGEMTYKSHKRELTLGLRVLHDVGSVNRVQLSGQTREAQRRCYQVFIGKARSIGA